MAMEDDYGMIDGVINNGPKPTVADLEQQACSGQSISLMDLADAIHWEERGKKKSVVEQLKEATKQERKRHRPKRAQEGRSNMNTGKFTFEEMNLMCIYNTGSRTGLMESLT